MNDLIGKLIAAVILAVIGIVCYTILLIGSIWFAYFTFSFMEYFKWLLP